MNIALIDGVRSSPVPGALGNCQRCGQAMIAKCGEQLVWHWAHKGRRVCDPWWENEGPWHREWKGYFPADCHEILGHDATGEAHIADIKLPDGLVIELQHSAMPLDEMRSREVFYGHMIWVVDAEPFRRNISVFDPLPDPSNDFVGDLIFATPEPNWRSSIRRAKDFSGLMFFRRSERDPDSSLQLLHSGRELDQYFPDTYTGHHLFHWLKPREVWFQTTKPIYLDLGDELLAQLMQYGNAPDAIWCLKLLSKNEFISRLLVNMA